MTDEEISRRLGDIVGQLNALAREANKAGYEIDVERNDIRVCALAGPLAGNGGGVELISSFTGKAIRALSA